MKNLVLFLMAMFFVVTVNAQDQKKASGNGTNERAVMQDGNSSKQNDKAVMQDGNSSKGEQKAVMQDGNSATTNEKKAVMQDGNSKLAEHRCNDKCTSAKHNYLHGEKGHQCTDACKAAEKK